MKISYRALGNAFIFIVLFCSTGAFLSLVVGTTIQDSDEGSPLTQVFWAVVYLIVIVRVISGYRLILPLVRANKCLCLLVLLANVSALWSQDPVTTIHRGIALLGITLFGIDFAAHYSIREQLRFACIVLGSVIALSIVAEIFFPGLFPHLGPDPSAWQGIFGHKNTLGRIIALAAVAFLSLPRRRNTLVIVTLMVMAGALLVVAHSASSLVELIVLVVISQVLGLLRWTPSKLIVTAFLSLLIAIPTAYLVLTNLDRVAGMLGRDATLTGRTEIWRLASESIARRPILGYGYDVFWDSSSQEGTRIRSAVGWEAPTAHDGYLEVLLDLGFAGLLLYAVACVVTVRRAVILFRRGPASNMIWPLLFMAEVLLSQITESTVIRPNSIFWIMSVAIAFSVSKTPIVLDGTMSDRDPSESLPEAVLAEV